MLFTRSLLEERCKPFSSSANFSMLFCQELFDLHILSSTYKLILFVLSHIDVFLLQFTVNSSNQYVDFSY